MPGCPAPARESLLTLRETVPKRPHAPQGRARGGPPLGPSTLRGSSIPKASAPRESSLRSPNNPKLLSFSRRAEISLTETTPSSFHGRRDPGSAKAAQGLSPGGGSRPRQARSLPLGRPAPVRPATRRGERPAPESLPRGCPPPSGPPLPPRAPRRRIPPAAPGCPGPLVAEPARAATCRGRRASQRPAAAILHFKPAALFRESTLTCEPYPRNRSAGRHTASAARRAPRSLEGRGGGARRGARPSGRPGAGRGREEPAEAGPSARAPSARPHPSPRLAPLSGPPLLS
ncbi:translation initiation factor IF-2-like [Equus quagga]|uniref:translation initiation factor IF-2-like n=1 Tax=Equus quagga TaxID=89248 RepID=UPI001EE270AC|nr:translation initiation factor IF-2-like [Equus quagga]